MKPTSMNRRVLLSIMALPTVCRTAITYHFTLVQNIKRDPSDSPFIAGWIDILPRPGQSLAASTGVLVDEVE
jgi:hypothetical protein